MNVHIEGMGVNGCLLALQLHHAGVPFTWHDNRSAHTAWRACTGAIYPSGSSKFGPDEECRAQWLRWAEKSILPQRTLEYGRFIFSTKTEPHNGKHGHQQLSSGLRVSNASSLHLNAQRLVQVTRALFDRRNISHQAAVPNELDAYIVSHGFGERHAYNYWGWTRLVELNLSEELQGDVRPAFYFRQGRFVMAYAYPVPGSKDLWYAGSSIIKQKGEPRSYDVQSKYERWRDNFNRLGLGAVTVGQEGQIIEGWRPAADPTDKNWLKVSTKNNVKHIQLRPLWNSGVRHFPVQWEGVRRVLGLPPEDSR